MGTAGPCAVEFHYCTLRGLWTLCGLHIYVLNNGLDMVCLGCPLVQGQPCWLRTSLCMCSGSLVGLRMLLRLDSGGLVGSRMLLRLNGYDSL